jgi:hypothetical protein
MRNYSYEERLKLFNLTTLVTRRISGDLIEVFRILKGLAVVNAQIFFLNYHSYVQEDTLESYLRRGVNWTAGNIQLHKDSGYME